MMIEAGGRMGLIAPNDMTSAFLEGRDRAPKGAAWARAVAYWRTLRSDDDAAFDREVTLHLGGIAPHVTWGTSPDEALPITASVPAGSDKALAYMDLAPATPLTDIAIDRVFIGSCTNGRLEDLRDAAAVSGRRCDPRATAIVVPGSTATKAAAAAERLDPVVRAAGFEWRDAGCSMCVAMNDDRLAPGERCASTSNRNFEGRRAAPGFVLDQPGFAGAPILIAGANFGCGSSREQAVWALRGAGIRCVIAASFGEIFHGNCLRNGVLPVTLPAHTIAALAADAAEGRSFTIDLAATTIAVGDGLLSFAIPEEQRQALLNGWDETDLILGGFGERIAAFEAAQRAAQPWLWESA